MIGNSIFLETKKVFDNVEIETKIKYAKEEIQKTLDEITKEANENIPALQGMEFEMNSDYSIDSAVDTNNRMNIFVSYNSQDELVQKKMNLEGRKGRIAKALYDSLKDTVTPSDVAEYLLNSLKVKFKNNVKFFRDGNVIAVKIPNLIYLRFIVGIKKEDRSEFIYFGKKIEANITEQTLAFIDKNMETSSKFVETIKMFKLMETELLARELVYSRKQEQPSFVENLLYNVPNKMFNFEEETYNKNFVEIIKYLKEADFNTFKTADLKLPMFEKEMFENALYDKKETKQLIEHILFFCENFA